MGLFFLIFFCFFLDGEPEPLKALTEPGSQVWQRDGEPEPLKALTEPEPRSQVRQWSFLFNFLFGFWTFLFSFFRGRKAPELCDPQGVIAAAHSTPGGCEFYFLFGFFFGFFGFFGLAWIFRRFGFWISWISAFT